MTVEATHEEVGLKRSIGRRTLLIFVVGDVLGAGIYVLVGEVGAETGGAIWTAFTLALILAAFTACAYAELVTKYPRAAGAALYVNRAFRKPFVSFMVTFAVMASGVTSASTLARGFAGDYLEVFIDVPVVATATVFLLVVAAVNFRGIAESVRLNIVLTTIEVSGLLLICVIALGALADGAAGTDAGRAFTFDESEGVLAAMIGGAGLAFYALIGFEDSVNVAEETKDPRHDYPRALFGGLAVAGAIYIAVTILASMTVPTGTLAASSGPLNEVATTGPLSVNPKLFSGIALFALANGALINMVMASRLLYGMSNEGVLPRALGKVHRGRRTPWVSILATTALGIVLVSTGDLADLADMTVFLLLGVFVMVNVAVLVLRREEVEHDHFRAPRVIPVLGAVVSLALMILETEGRIAARAVLLLAVGVALYAVDRLTTGGRDPIGQ
jgi:amino acid transporter